MKGTIGLILLFLLCASPASAELSVGGTRISEDSVIGPSGKPVLLYGWCMVSGGTAGQVIFRDGTSTSGTAQLTENGTASQGDTDDLGGAGLIFPNGLFADIDANVSTLDVYYKKR